MITYAETCLHRAINSHALAIPFYHTRKKVNQHCRQYFFEDCSMLKLLAGQAIAYDVNGNEIRRVRTNMNKFGN